MPSNDLVAATGLSRRVVAGVASAAVLLAGFGGIAWALSSTKQRAVDVSASYTIRVGMDESKQQQLFRVGDAVVATECSAGLDNGVFAVGGKALTITNAGSDPIVVVIGERQGTVGGPSNPPPDVRTLSPGEDEAFGNVGVAATANDTGSGGLFPFAILSHQGRSASGTFSFWYDAPDGPVANPIGTCVASAQMRG